MNELAPSSPAPRPLPAPLPAPRRAIAIRPATMADLPFLDAMQKMNGRALGYFPTKQFEGYIEGGHVLVAEEKVEGGGWKVEEACSASAAVPPPSALYPQPSPAKLGYIISRDRYLKRDELGVIYQLCVAPGEQRKLIGAALVREVFERSAYGCRLYCCWCAQDLEANHFWESLGFVPIAFRGGSSGKKACGRQRVHIFWQRRIREGDTTTAWWFPAKTDSGAMREDRIVLPIPPGLRWSDPMPVLVSASSGEGSRVAGGDPKPRRVSELEIGSKGGPLPPTPRPRAGVQFGPPRAQPLVVEQPKFETKPKRAPKPKVTIDPAMVSKARELRDRYLERINAPLQLSVAQGKYDVSRALQADHAVLHRLVG